MSHLLALGVFLPQDRFLLLTGPQFFHICLILPLLLMFLQQAQYLFPLVLVIPSPRSLLLLLFLLAQLNENLNIAHQVPDAIYLLLSGLLLAELSERDDLVL